jgi:hypothetical protein
MKFFARSVDIHFLILYNYLCEIKLNLNKSGRKKKRFE